MSTYENHIDALEASKELPGDTVEVAQGAISFVAALHDMYVANGILNEDSPVDLAVLENLTDAMYGELAAAALYLAQDEFNGSSALLRATSSAMEDPDNIVPLVVRKGFERLANRIDRTRELQIKLADVG